MAMVPGVPVTYWQWISLTLAAPVVVWAAWPFHRAAWANVFAVALVVAGYLSRRGAYTLLGLFLAQFALAWLLPRTWPRSNASASPRCTCCSP